MDQKTLCVVVVSKFVFIKNSSASLLDEDKPIILIKKIKIEGSSLGAGIRCSDCEENSIRIIKDSSFYLK